MHFVSGLILAGLLVLTGCQPDDDPPAGAVYSVPTDVEPYVQHFRDEARQRGQPIAVANLVVTFGKTSGGDVCGQCLLEAGQPPRVILSADGYCWQNANANERECLVFHELGHCLLGRGHRTERFPNQSYVSLMNPDNTGVYATCRYPIDDFCDKRPRREHYVNELFDPATPTPVWAK